jgi:predicted DNA-binding protein
VGSTTIRVSEDTRARFAEMADRTGRPMTQLLDEAVDALERRLFFDELRHGFDQLRSDKVAWREIERERDLESATLRDAST